MIGIRFATLAACAVVVGCSSKEVPHSGENPLYSLTGAHQGLPCEECHGPLTGCNSPQKLPTQCIACHASDVPEPDHYTGQDCVGCHTTTAWGELATTPYTGETGTGPVTDPQTVDTTGPFVHDPEDPNEVCWDCHEQDRPADHSVSPEKWDCGPWHDQVAWSDPQTDHPVRTPHGEKKHGLEQPADQWVVACEGCHPSSPPAFVCSDCHGDIFPHTTFGGPAAPGAAADQTCLGCHDDAEL